MDIFIRRTPKPLSKPKKKKKIKIKRPRGRIRYNFSYDEAKDVVRSEGITSAVEYHKWWMLNHPSRMPKRPDRAYKNNNFLWSKFLGVKNNFPSIRKKTFVSYEECQQFVARNNIKSRTEWREFLRNYEKPDNIPAHPELVYRGTKTKPGKWISYNKFFDTKPLERIEKVSKMEEYLIIYKIDAKFNNIFYFSQKLCSPLTLLAECKKILEKYEIYAVYLVGTYNYKNFLNRNFKEYIGTSNCYSIENINDLYFNFDINMTNKINDVINSL